MTSLIIPWCILSPILASFGIFLTRKSKNLREGVTLTTAVFLFILVYILFKSFLNGEKLSWLAFEMLPGLNIAFEIEPLGLFFALVASSLWILTSIYAIGYMRGHEEKNQTRFYICFAIAIGSTIGISFSSNLLTLFIFYEILTVSTFPLVTHSGTDKAKRAGRIYLGILLGTSVCLLLVAIIWTWILTGTLDFTQGGIFKDHVDETVVTILLMMFVFGVGKAAIMPFHHWLPSAMVAPTPVSALLHAVAVVKAGVFTILKISIYIFGLDYLREIESSQWLQFVACVTILVGSLIALTKDNLKARLAYSTVSQLSYIVLAAMMANELAALGGAMHIAMHAFGKITLFFCAGSILVATHYTEVSQMQGLGRKMPITFFCFLIGSLSIIGLPPFGGLWSKWFILLGAAEGLNLFFIFVLITSSLLNVGYLIPIVVRGFFSNYEVSGNKKTVSASPSFNKKILLLRNSTRFMKFTEAPLFCIIATCSTGIGCFLLFFSGDFIYQFLLLIFRN